jgi:hypothetical protein
VVALESDPSYIVTAGAPVVSHIPQPPQPCANLGRRVLTFQVLGKGSSIEALAKASAASGLPKQKTTTMLLYPSHAAFGG